MGCLSACSSNSTLSDGNNNTGRNLQKKGSDNNNRVPVISDVDDSHIAAKAKVAIVLITMRVPMKDHHHNLDKLCGIT